MGKGKFSIRGFILDKFLINQAEKHSWLPYGTAIAMNVYAFTPGSVWRTAGKVGLRVAGRLAVLGGLGLNVKPGSAPSPGSQFRFPGELPQEPRSYQTGNVSRSFNRAFASSHRLGAMRAAPLMLGGAGILQMSRMLNTWMSPDPMTTTH